MVRSQNLLSQAWHLVHGFKGTFWLAMLYAVGLLLLLTLITLPIHFFGVFAGIVHPTDFLMGIIISYFTLPAGLGIYLLAVQHANHQPIKAVDIFSYYRLPIMGQIFLLTLLFIAMMVGLLMIPSWWLRGLLVLIFIYSTTIWIFSTMLVAEQDISFVPAIGKAAKAVGIHAIKIIGLYIFIGLLLLLGLLTAGIALIWILPFIINILALMYRDFFCAMPTHTD